MGRSSKTFRPLAFCVWVAVAATVAPASATTTVGGGEATYVAPTGSRVALGVFDGTGAIYSAGIIDQPDLLSNGFLNGLPIPPPAPAAPPFAGPPFPAAPFAGLPLDGAFLGGPPPGAFGPSGQQAFGGRRFPPARPCPLIIKVGGGLKRTVPTRVTYGRRVCGN